jgi:hypothetical protein
LGVDHSWFDVWEFLMVLLGAPGARRSLSQEIRTAPGILLESKAHHIVCRESSAAWAAERRYLTM